MLTDISEIPMPRLEHRFNIDMFSHRSKELNQFSKLLITGCEIDYFNNTFKVYMNDPLENSEMLHNALFNDFVKGNGGSFNSSHHFIYISDDNGDCFVTLKVKPISHKIEYTYSSDNKQAVHECLFQIYDIDAVS